MASKSIGQTTSNNHFKMYADSSPCAVSGSSQEDQNVGRKPSPSKTAYAETRARAW
ncbi:hypothetical protein HanRHA438_Chr00c05g0845351 [Helianthus annuus]|nr:hypothetical protein HanRHA438_Chr00c05g0845351 [Helianthus annuus]